MHRTRRTAVIGAALATTALTFSSIGVAADSHLTGYAELDQAMGEDQPLAGTRVTIKTQFIDEGPNFEAALVPFTEATGIEVEHIPLPSGDHETALLVDIEGGSPPDLSLLAQPSNIIDYGDSGNLVDIATILDIERLNAEYSATAPLYVGANGEQWAIPFKVGVKSIVWYPIKAFEAAGYAVPTTWDELVALSDRIVQDGSAPWCVGIDANDATGWIATDWIEDIMLRTAPIETYNAWANHEIPFNSPEVKNAWDLLGQMWFTDGYVFGGSDAILATWQGDPMDPMWGPNLDSLENPSCWMHKQADWYGPENFPDYKAIGETAFPVGEDIGLFYFPEIDPEYGTPALGAGDGLMVFDDRPEVRALAQFLATPEGMRGWIERSTAISANQTTPADWYQGNYESEILSGIVANATSFGFDASDVMPNSGSAFWAGVVKWVEADGTNTDEVLEEIEASWS